MGVSSGAQRRPGLSPRRPPSSGNTRRNRSRQRSTKAGAFTPATLGLRDAPRGQRYRSTKAGAFTPATPHQRVSTSPAGSALNEDRGFHPGDPPAPPRARLPSSSLNEGRGFHPGDPPPACLHESSRKRAQRRPGLSPRRPANPMGRRPVKCGPLNEGRGFHPGDPCTQRAALTMFSSSSNSFAQRRPGLSPRRPPALLRCCPTPDLAQRRPGLSPRRPDCNPQGAEHQRRRSTKAGAFTPATRRTDVCPRLDDSRSTKAGAFTPATLDDTDAADYVADAQRRPGLSPRRPPVGRAVECAGDSSLNEGRGFHPGDPP